MFSSLKNYGMKKTVQIYIGEVGQVLDFKYDSEDKRIFISMDLKGESEPLEIEITDFQMITKDDFDYLIFDKIETSKPWLDFIIKEFVKNKEIKMNSKMKLLFQILK